MQLRLVSSPQYGLPQRVEPVEGVSAQSGENHSRQQTGQSRPANESTRIFAITAYENARREYDYSRIEAVDGRAARALQNYIEVENEAEREELQKWLGLDLFV